MLPFYLSIGVSYELYWYGDPWAVAAYREAEIFRQERANYEAWLSGRYIYDALQSVIGTFSWGLGGKKGTKPDPYEQYPYAFTEREKAAEKQRKIEATLRWIEAGQKRGAQKANGKK